MNTLLSQIDLIIECRDYRVPLTSRNPLFEQSLAGRERLVVYTKRDLGNSGKAQDAEVRFKAANMSEIKSARLIDRRQSREKTYSDSGIGLLLSCSRTTKISEMFVRSSNSPDNMHKLEQVSLDPA